jgi:PAB1-binding protein PBP1
MFNKIKEFFTGIKPAVETTQEVPLTAVDVAIKNIKETTEAVVAKVEVAAVAKPKRAAPKEPEWTKKAAPPITKTAKPKQQSVKTAVPAAKKKPPAPK